MHHSTFIHFPIININIINLVQQPYSCLIGACGRKMVYNECKLKGENPSLAILCNKQFRH
jgi:hypothetical protein